MWAGAKLYVTGILRITADCYMIVVYFKPNAVSQRSGFSNHVIPRMAGYSFTNIIIRRFDGGFKLIINLTAIVSENRHTITFYAQDAFL